MLQPGDSAPNFSLYTPGVRRGRDGAMLDGGPALLVFIETDCPSCRLTLPYLDRLHQKLGLSNPKVIAVSQDREQATQSLIEQLQLTLPVVVDHDLSISRLFDPKFVPALFLLDHDRRVLRADIGFDKSVINEVGKFLLVSLGFPESVIADPFDGMPPAKPGCSSRHIEGVEEGFEPVVSSPVVPGHGRRASRIVLEDTEDPYKSAVRMGFADPLPIILPTAERVDEMLAATDLRPDLVIAQIPPNYGNATVEKIAANAVIAGSIPEMMQVLIPLVRAVADERFNIHGVQATTHFAAPLIIVNGPVRQRLGFASAGNVFSNIARANSTLGRALQLILINLGGARPGEIDMSTLGNPGKFSYCIAENEEQSPWQPFHVDQGFRADQSAVTLFAAEPPKGVSEHTARTAKGVLKAICRELATSWSYLTCGVAEAIVVLCPEHVRTIARDGFSKEQTRDYLFANTGIPLKHYSDADGQEGTQLRSTYKEIEIDGEPCYQKFRSPESIRIIVAGGTAGKFSAVISSWVTGPRGSQMVTYPID